MLFEQALLRDGFCERDKKPKTHSMDIDITSTSVMYNPYFNNMASKHFIWIKTGKQGKCFENYSFSFIRRMEKGLITKAWDSTPNM